MTTLLFVLISTMQPQPAATSALQSFSDYVQREWPGETTQQAINCKGLSLMTDAVTAVASTNPQARVGVMKELERFQERSRQYCAAVPADREQADRLRRTFIDGGALLKALAGSTTPRTELSARVNALERAAKSLDDDAPLRRQPDVIERYFHHASEVLKMLDR